MSQTSVIALPARQINVCECCLIANRPLSRMRGLLGRRELTAGEGLLLAPAGSIHTHFMRFAIDAVFLDGDSRVVGVRSAMAPWHMARARGAKAVLELRAGEAQERGIQVGDVLQVGSAREALHV
ncbi:MAG TPA: DUF192 domain-containing protein [Candidatus Saccharimonadales bacterium]|nr:DUF192 domain-containing protein [Candidatus Saccharimonadales bacterium]